MPFFLPGERDPAKAETLYAQMREAAARGTRGAVLSRRIHSIHYQHNGKLYTAVVGEVELYTGSLVLAIFEVSDGRMFWITTAASALGRANPIWVGRDTALEVVSFE